MTQLSNVCSAFPVNNKTILFDGHDRHFYDRVLMHMERQKIQPFVLKSGNYVSAQTNDNGLNVGLNSLYNYLKAVWMMKYGTKTFLPHPVKSVLVESWESFKVSARNTIRYRFAKTNLPPSSLPN